MITFVTLVEKSNTYLKGIANNDTKVITEIYESYGPMVAKYVLENSGNIQDAKDVMQDAMIVIYKKIDKGDFELTSSFQTYLFSVCRFIWLRKIKKNKKEVITSTFEDRLTTNQGWEDTLIESRKLVLMKTKISELSAECRQLLSMSFKGVSGKDIAGQMNYTVEFVKRKRFRCKNALIKAIKADPEFQLLNQNIS